MAQNFIKVFMGIDLAFVSVDNDIIVGRSHLANRVELITPVTLGTDDVMQIFFELANGNTTPKRSMVATGSTETVGNDEHNVFRYDIPQSVLSAITSANASTIKVQFRKATIGTGEGNPVASGTATAGGASTLTDSTKTFTTNQFANFVLFIVSGAGAGQKRTIASNTATVLTVTTAWTVQPTTTSVYSIRPITTIAQALATSAQVSLALDASIIPNSEDEVIEIDVFDELSGDINNKLNKNFTQLTAKAVPDDTDLIAIDEGSGTNKKVTVATIVGAAVASVEGLQANIDEITTFVDQDVSIGSNPAFATPTVDGITFRNNGDTSTIDYADALAINATQAHIDATDNPHSVTAEQVGLGDADNTSDADKPISDDTQTALDDKQDELVSGTDIKTINSATILASGNLDLIAASEKGVTVATLVSGKVPANQLPSFVDDLEEYANLAAFPATGESDKIFVALDTGKIFRWSGSQYVEIAANEVNSVNSKTGVVTLDKTDIGLGNVANAAQVTAVTATAPIESTGGTTPAISIVAATDAVAGSMSAADKAKLDNLTADTIEFDTPGFTGQLETDAAETITFAVTVQNVDGINVYFIDGVERPTLAFLRGGVYTFDQSDSTNAGHPLRFKDLDEYSFTQGVVATGTPGTANAQVVFTVPNDAPASLRYYCTVHGNAMGNTISITGDGVIVTIQDAMQLLDTHTHLAADITNLSATVVPYDNTGQNLVATNVQTALNEIDDLVEEGLTQVVVTKFEITDDDNGTGGFTYDRNAETEITGTFDTGKFVFTLPNGVEYGTGNNRLSVKIDGSNGALKRLFYGADDELTEPSDTTFAIDFALVTGDVLYAQLFQSLATVFVGIGDTSVTEAKIADGAVTTVKIANNNVTLAKAEQIATNTMLGNDTGDTANVKALTVAETKTLLALNNVDNTTDLNKPISTNTQTALDAKVTGVASAVNNRVATFNGTTGKLIKDSGFTIETSVPSNAVFTDTGEDNIIEIVQAEGTPLSIASKTVNVTRSALGAGTGDANVVFLTTTIAAVDWTGSSAPYSVAVDDITGILNTDRPIIDLDLSDVDYADVADTQAAYALIYRAAATATDTITFFATDEPSEELVIQIKVVR